MYLLNKDAYSKIHHLIKGIDPDCSFAYSVALNGNPGRIYVDDSLDPKACIIAGAGGVYLVAGSEREEDFNYNLVEFLKDKVNHIKYYDLFATSERWIKLLAKRLEKDSIPLPRTTYTYQQAVPPMFHRDIKLEEGYLLKRMDEALFHQFNREMYSIYQDTWGTVENFIEKGIAYAILHKDEIASVCFACSSGGGYTEIGVLTNKKYHQRGYALIVCSAFIEECLEKKMVAVWNCGRGNQPSEQLAKKLGFTFVKYSDLIFWHTDRAIIESYLDGTNFL